MSGLTRRRFLGVAAGAVAAVGCSKAGGPAAAPASTALPASTAPPGPKRTLVVVELSGGNDALNTVVPADGRYRDARPALAVPEADVVAVDGIDGAAGFHPALAPLVDLWTAGELAVVQGLGYDHAGRSHFECRQHWWDGVEPGTPSPTGWLGRWLDATQPDGDADLLRAVAIGTTAPMLRAERSTPTVVLDPSDFGITAGADPAALAAALDAAARRPAPAGAVDLVAQSAAATVAAFDAAHRLAGALGDAAPDRSLAADLALAGELLAADLGIDVLVVGAGGYDTHAGQLARHQDLLADLAAGLVAFRANASDGALLVTTSEFGRRVAENGSGGTDHGLAGTHLVLGAGVAGGRSVGRVDLAMLHEGDVAPTVDPRSYFATALDWLGGPTADVLTSYDDLGLLR